MYNGNGCPCQQQSTAKISGSLSRRSGNGSRREISQRGDDPVITDFFDLFTAVIFSLRSKPKFAKNITVDREGGATPDCHVQFVLCELPIHQEGISISGK
jgi:hypothetical protein